VLKAFTQWDGGVGLYSTRDCMNYAAANVFEAHLFQPIAMKPDDLTKFVRD